MIYNTEKFPPKLDYYYIVWLRDFLKLTLYPVYFINQVSAKRAIKNNFGPRKRARYTVISGKKLREYQLTYTIKLGRLPKFTKYDYPPNATFQQRKTMRTNHRRRLRRMGILIPKKHKYHIKEKVKQARVLINRQDVANCPNTDAKAFRLERKPKRYYYVIISKEKSKRKGVMWKMDCIRYNSKNGEYKRLFMHIYNKDVILPHLLSEVYAQALKKGNYGKFKGFCSDLGVRLNKVKAEKVL